MIEEVISGGVLYATIIRREFHKPGVHFFTPANLGQQLGFMSHPAGHHIPPHFHREVEQVVRRTQEALFIRSGKLRVDFFTDLGTFLESRTLSEGDVILLVSGGHGFEILDPCEMIEVKQGPYLGDSHKIPLRSATDRREAGS